MIIGAASHRTLFTAYNAAFQRGFKGVDLVWPKLAEAVKSTTAEEKYPFLGDPPSIREWKGGRHHKPLELKEYSLENKDYEASVVVPVKYIEDDRYGVFTPRFQALGRRVAQFPDRLLFSILAAGFTELCYDGQPYFDDEHPNGRAGVTSNMQAGSGNPWFLFDTEAGMKPLIYQERKPFNLVSKDQPTDEGVYENNEARYGVDGRAAAGYGWWQCAFGSKATLDYASFNAAYKAQAAMVDDEGEPLGIMPRLLVVGPSNREKALEVIKRDRLDNGESNINRDAVEVLLTPWLP